MLEVKGKFIWMQYILLMKKWRPHVNEVSRVTLSIPVAGELLCGQAIKKAT